MIAIVVSRADSASEHIGERLREVVDWTAHEDDSLADADGGGTYYRAGGFELREFEDLHIYLSNPAAAFSETPEFLVFASRHSGETGPLLTGHFTGNFGDAEYGGADRTLSRAAPNALSVLVAAFEAHAPEGYDVGIECTHHGPTDLSVPSLFAELGSGEDEWADPAGARAVARGILSLDGVAPHRERQVVGFGGGHYAPRFTRVVTETPWAVGHVASDWQLDELGAVDESARAVIDQAFERSGAEYALLDDAPDPVADAITDLGYRVVSETWLRAVGDRSVDVVESLEADLSSVEDGLRFGDRDVDADADEGYATFDLPADLLDACRSVAPEATFEAVAASTVAFETAENGTRAVGRAAVPDSDADAVSALVDRLVAVLAESEKYEDVALDGDAVVAREAAFDPSKARERGVPEGPQFGRLAGGEAVEVDGDVVRPAEVTTERTHRFSVPELG